MLVVDAPSYGSASVNWCEC